jgi:hypothetical protein
MLFSLKAKDQVGVQIYPKLRLEETLPRAYVNSLSPLDQPVW